MNSRFAEGFGINLLNLNYLRNLLSMVTKKKKKKSSTVDIPPSKTVRVYGHPE